MIKYVFFYFLLITSSYAVAQSTKIYIDENGHFTRKIEDAKYYALYQKLQDTLYALKQYDMDDNLLAQGYYKDSLRTIPNGKFVYYEKVATNSLSQDTGSYVKATGNYSNGLPTGIWTYYSSKNIKYYVCSYKNGKLNGMYKKYYSSNNNIMGLEGLFADDKKQGEWRSYDTLGIAQQSDVFVNDSLVSRILHSKKMILPDNFFSNVFRFIGKKTLRKYDDSEFEINFTVNVDGSVTDVNFNKYVSPDDAKVISDAIIAAGKFEPSIYNDKPIKDTYTLRLGGKSDAVDSYPNNRAQIYTKHADLIGRGLNNVGIGKPLNDK